MDTRYDIRQVARYVLYRVSGDESADICEFRRQDQANAVLNEIRVDAVGDGLTDDTEKFKFANRALSGKYAGQGRI
jgi:hypothetical protein